MYMILNGEGGLDVVCMDSALFQVFCCFCMLCALHIINTAIVAMV